MALTLAQRLASASQTNRINLTDLERLIADATIERDFQAAAHVSQSTDAVNFRLAESDRDEAAKRADRAARNAAALDAAIAELEAKLQARRETDKRAVVETERKDALSERDALAERIKAEWPFMVAHMTALFEAIEANDARMKAVGLYDASSEAVARGCDGLFRFGVTPVRRLTETMVPSLNGHELAWPRPRKHYDMQAAVKAAVEATAEAESNRPKFEWYRATVTNGSANPYFGQFRSGATGFSQVSNGETDIQIIKEEATRLASVPGVTLSKLDVAPPPPEKTFRHPAA
jgi:hypothetical protein